MYLNHCFLRLPTIIGAALTVFGLSLAIIGLDSLGIITGYASPTKIWSDEHHLVLAANDRDVLQKLSHCLPALVVTNWQMPEVDGVELCHRLMC